MSLGRLSFISVSPFPSSSPFASVWFSSWLWLWLWFWMDIKCIFYLNFKCGWWWLFFHWIFHCRPQIFYIFWYRKREEEERHMITQHTNINNMNTLCPFFYLAMRRWDDETTSIRASTIINTTQHNGRNEMKWWNKMRWWSLFSFLRFILYFVHTLFLYPVNFVHVSFDEGNLEFQSPCFSFLLRWWWWCGEWERDRRNKKEREK